MANAENKKAVQSILIAQVATQYYTLLALDKKLAIAQFNSQLQFKVLDLVKTLKEGDTLEVKFKSGINEVCQKKGCWMTLDLADDKEAFVKFKDYGFFVPKNAQDKEVIVNGKAFVSVESVDVLKHYAKDAGKSQAAIDSITEPKVTYSFMADGVLIAK